MVILLVILFLNYLGEATPKSYILETLDPNDHEEGKSNDYKKGKSEPQNCGKVKVCQNGKIYPTSCDVPFPTFLPCEDFQKLGTDGRNVKDCICKSDNLCGSETPMTNKNGSLLHCSCGGGAAGNNNNCHPDQCPSGSSCVPHAADGPSQCCPDEGAQVCGPKNCGLICKKGQKCVDAGCRCARAPCCCSEKCGQRGY